MAEITIKVLAFILFESTFKNPVLFTEADCASVARKCLEAFSGYGLTPSQISVRTGDQTFNYDVSFSIFNGNGTFRFSAEKLEFSLQNATSPKDLEIVDDCVAKIYEHIPLPEIDRTSISAHCHAVFPSAEALRKFQVENADISRQIIWKGTIAYIRVENWAEEIRLMVDRSLVYTDGLFLLWTTSYRGKKISRDVLKDVRVVFVKSAEKLDLTLAAAN
jgi:hypothetical protein